MLVFYCVVGRCLGVNLHPCGLNPVSSIVAKTVKPCSNAVLMGLMGVGRKRRRKKRGKRRVLEPVPIVDDELPALF